MGCNAARCIEAQQSRERPAPKAQATGHSVPLHDPYSLARNDRSLALSALAAPGSVGFDTRPQNRPSSYSL